MMISMSKLNFAKTRLYGLLPCLMLAAAGWANAATTKVITVAGGYAGNGKPATAAGIDQLSSVAMDAKGNLYVTDSGNCQIRKINSKGIIVKSPALMYVDSAGTADRPPPRRLIPPQQSYLMARETYCSGMREIHASGRLHRRG
jgi:hypothetical protein